MKRALMVLGAAAALSGCASGPDVRSDYDPAYRFSSARTFFVAPFSPETRLRNPHLGPGTEAGVRRAIADELEAKGLREAARGEADLLVSYTEGRELRTRVVDWGPPPWRCDPYARGRPWYDYEPVTVQQYYDAEAMIDVSDRRTGRPVWRGIGGFAGWARFSTPEELAEVVRAILSDFPPGSERGAVD